jgi:hypothetical protein
MFTFCTLATSVILYQGLKASAAQIITVVLGFLVICTGIFILQMSKVDPRELTNVDRRTTLLLQAARAEIDPKSARDLERDDTNSSRLSRRRIATSAHSHMHGGIVHAPVNGADLEALADGFPSHVYEQHVIDDLESGYPDLEDEARAVVEKTEDPGIDSLRGTFGTIGTIIRARRRTTALSQSRSARSRTSSSGMADDHRSSPRGTRAMVKEGGDVEKKNVPMRGGLSSATPENEDDGGVLVASLLSTTPGSHGPHRAASIHFGEGNSAPVTLERMEPDDGDPVAHSGTATEEAARIRAQTLPMTSNSERTRTNARFFNAQPQL